MTVARLTNVPFKFNATWINHPGFMKTVKDSWEREMAGRPFLRLMRKLQMLKTMLKRWNQQTYGDTTERIKKLEIEVM